MINAKARHDPEDLNVWGRAAAMLYINKAVPLSQAVYKIVKDKELTAEHIKRILEVANIAGCLEEYARLDSKSRIVNFPGGPATFDKVLKLMNKTAGESAMSHEDYDAAPLDYKVAKAVQDTVGMDKAASERVIVNSLDDVSVGAGGHEDLNTLYFKVNSAIDTLNRDVLKLSSFKSDLEENITKMLKEAIMDGNSLGNIRYAACPQRSSFFDNALVKAASDSSMFQTNDDVAASFKDVSYGSVPQEEHPLRTTTAAYTQVSRDLKTKLASIVILKRHKENILTLVRERGN